MEPLDQEPEEVLGTAACLHKRAAELRRLADACDREAREAEASVVRLSARAHHLREVADETDAAARAAEQAQRIGADMVQSATRQKVATIGGEPPIDPQTGDEWYEQDQVDPTTYRRHEYHSDMGWGRIAPMNGIKSPSSEGGPGWGG